MAAPAVLATPPVMPILTQFTDQVADCKTPGAVLDRLALDPEPSVRAAAVRELRRRAFPTAHAS